jgi:glycosyltransferase involved in cell wall biosynthesis
MRPPVVKHAPVDVLIDVPYIWLNDGYGQTSPHVIRIMGELCDELGLTWGVLHTAVVTNLPEYSESIQFINKHFIDKNESPSSKILFRYHYPSKERCLADKLVSYTMFETDQCPSGWIDILNTADLVLVPNPYLEQVFQKSLSVPVKTVYLPLNNEYYEDIDDNSIVSHLPTDFTFNFVGTYSTADRKNIGMMMDAFDSAFSHMDDVAFVLKSRGYKLKHGKTISCSIHTTLKNMLMFYLSSHVGVYVSRGEGYGLPQLENAILGRPVIMADNSAAIWSWPLIRWGKLLPCKPGLSHYTNKTIGEPGNWGFCEKRAIHDAMTEMYESWKSDPDAFKQYMIDAHRNSPLHKELSRGNIKRQLKEHLVPLL